MHCTWQMSYLYVSDFPFKDFCKHAEQAQTIQKNVWEKSNDVYFLLIRVQNTKPHNFQFVFSHNINITGHIGASSVVWTLINKGKLANQIVRLAVIVVK